MRDGDGDWHLRCKARREGEFQSCGYVERTAQGDRVRVVFGGVGQADGQQRQSDLCFLAGPIEKIGKCKIDVELEWIARIGGIAGLYVGDFSAKSVEGEDRLAEFLPLRLRRSAESGAQDEFRIAAHAVVQMSGERAEIADAAFDFHLLRGKKRRVGGRFDDFPIAIGRHKQSGLSAQRQCKQAEGRDFGGCVHPNEIIAFGNGRDDVIELRWRR